MHCKKKVQRFGEEKRKEKKHGGVLTSDIYDFYAQDGVNTCHVPCPPYGSTFACDVSSNVFSSRLPSPVAVGNSEWKLQLIGVCDMVIKGGVKVGCFVCINLHSYS